MRKEDVLRLPSMPAASPSYPAGPYHFITERSPASLHRGAELTDVLSCPLPTG
jgi:acetoacetate decarboxylase